MFNWKKKLFILIHIKITYFKAAIIKPWYFRFTVRISYLVPYKLTWLMSKVMSQWYKILIKRGKTGGRQRSLLWWTCVCLPASPPPASMHCEWHLPADINTKAENRAISSSDRCIEHKFFPNSKTELIKSSQPATAKDTERGLRMKKTKEQHSLLIFIGREARREGRGKGKKWKGAACWQHMGVS